MRLFIIGQKWLGAEVLKLAAAMGHQVAGACCPYWNGEGDGRDKLCQAAESAGVVTLATYCPQQICPRLMPEGIELIVLAHADWFIPAEIRAAAVHGAILFHPSLLPRHRGRDAIRWAIHMGEAVTGGTIFRLVDKGDAGPILAQEHCFIRPGDTAADLWRRELCPLALRLYRQVLADPLAALAAARPQDEALATWEPAFSRKPLAPVSPPITPAPERCSAGANDFGLR
jgi:methionyl-tRNA formyltransferase